MKDQPDPDLWDDDPHVNRPAPNGFDYAGLPEPLRRQAQECAVAIHDLLGPLLMIRSGPEVVRVGLALQAVRGPLGEKPFERWLAAEFQWRPNGAAKLIRTATVFQGIDCLDKLQPKAMYLLSRPVVPAKALTAALGLARAGKRITRSRAEWILRYHGDVSMDVDDAWRALLHLERAVRRITTSFPSGGQAAVGGLTRRLASVLFDVYLLQWFCKDIEQRRNKSSDPERLAEVQAAAENPDSVPSAGFAVVAPPIPPESGAFSSTQVSQDNSP